YVGQATVIHYGGGSSSRQPSKWATVMKHTAMRRLFRKMNGRSYEWTYQAAMGCVALFRMAILAAALPFSRAKTVKGSLEKWKAVFGWAVGFDDLAAEQKTGLSKG